MHGMYLCTLCADLGAGVCLFACLSEACMSLTLYEKKRLRKELLFWSLLLPLCHCSSSQLPTWLFDKICLRLSCFCWESLHYPPAVQDIGSQEGVAAWSVQAAQAKLQIPDPPRMPWETDPALGVNTVNPPASSSTCPFSLGLPAIFPPSQPEYSFFLVQMCDISSSPNSHKPFLPAEGPSSAPLQNVQASLQVMTHILSNSRKFSPSSPFL